MMRRAILPAALLLVTAACGGTVSATGGTGSGGAGAGTTTGTGTTTSTSTSTTSSSGTTALGTVTLTMDSFTVAPGAEVYYCQDFANPFGNQDVEVEEFESHMTPGSHHLLLFYKAGATNGALTPCSGLEFAATPYGSQLPDDSLTFPSGVAALVPGTQGMRIQSHYLNTTQSAIDAKVTVTMHLAPPGSVQNQAGVLFLVDPFFQIQPNSTAVVSEDCTIPQDMNLLEASSHMHMHGTNFLATIAGNTVYQTTTWSEPKPAHFSPPQAIQSGAAAHFACTFVNNGSSTLTFGESALTNEMCIFSGSFYPVVGGQAVLGAAGTGGTVQCTHSQM